MHGVARAKRKRPEKPPENRPKTENGAGIAADPTLTDAWSCARGHLNLASGVSPFHRGQAASDRLYHRRSHRHPDPPSCGYFHPVRWTRRSAPLSGKLPRSTGGSAVGLPLVAGLRKLRVASIRRPRRTPLPLSDRTIRPVSKTFGASSSPAFPPGTEVRRQSASKAAWTGFLHVFPVLNLSKYQAVTPSIPKQSQRRSDELKLPCAAPIGKLGKPGLSTIPRFRCGRGWISSRLVAKLKGS